MLFTLFLHLVALPAALHTVVSLDGIDGINHTPEVQGPQRVYDDQLGVAASANSWLVVDGESGKDLYSHNENAVAPIASITKLMTASVFLDTKPNLNESITILETDRAGGGTIRLHPGEKVRLGDVLHSALIASDNDAATILQRSTGLSEEEFVQRMNAKAKKIGLYYASFVEPTGLDARNVATAREVIIMLQHALTYPEIAEVVHKPQYSFTVEEGGLEREVHLYSTNHLQGSIYSIIGGKTGYIEEAGYCLVVQYKSGNGQDLYISVLGSASISDRFQDVKMLSEWVESHYIW